LTLSGAVPVSLSAYARITSMRANIEGPPFSATCNSVSIAACQPIGAVAHEHQQNQRENKSSRTSIFGKMICQL
jgi:hypothetical protein